MPILTEQAARDARSELQKIEHEALYPVVAIRAAGLCADLADTYQDLIDTGQIGHLAPHLKAEIASLQRKHLEYVTYMLNSISEPLTK